MPSSRFSWLLGNQNRSTQSMEDIAIVGVAFKLPQDAVDEVGLWHILEQRRNVMTEWPASRLNIDSFFDANPAVRNKMHFRGAHFLEQDIAAFDAPFFSISSQEAAAMDPQHRLALQTAYHAFENAGLPMASLKGSRTAVFAASMVDDYAKMMVKDPDKMPRAAATALGLTILPNRISWFFDLKGPSIFVDTACSGSMTALNLACQALYNGDASAALVIGTNILLTPEMSISMSTGGFLSGDSVCHSFDHKANGYARGEGVVGICIKRVSDAVRDGDMIRAVIRSIGANQDGRTPVLTQPNPASQEQLIRHVYQKAGLDFALTRFFEAHGTGTAVGDPIEAMAIGKVFGPYRSAEKPLYVGSIKSNIGHTEGSSGLAGLVKGMLVLEKGIIPPNALFEKLNPQIDAKALHLAIPTQPIAWPSEGLRRVSVNSFGYGGSNAHVVMDDAFHYLESRYLNGLHKTIPVPHVTTSGVSAINGVQSAGLAQRTTPLATNGAHHTRDLNTGPETLRLLNGDSQERSPPEDRQAVVDTTCILIWSAANEQSLKRVVHAYEPYYRGRISGDAAKLDELARTLALRRSLLRWRSYAVVNCNDEVLPPVKYIRASTDGNTSLAFLFTGQGAQYAGMGRGLLQYPVFQRTLQAADTVFQSLGCRWSVFEEMNEQSHIDDPEYAQPLCTALQIALAELLKSFGLEPKAVIGHSSGEIAAAYTVGALSLPSACRVAYYRGQLASKLRASSALPYAMISVNIPADEVKSFLAKVDFSANLVESINVSCINSPLNSTLSGREDAIDILLSRCNADGIFAQKLKTGIGYHSPSMQAIAAEYASLMGTLSAGNLARCPVISMVSSVTGKLITSLSDLTEPQYWVDNMVSPVRFSDALEALTRLGLGSAPLEIVEVGPHPALRRPVQDTMSSISGLKAQIQHSHVLHRSKPNVYTILELVGLLFSRGYPISIDEINHSLGKRRSSHFRLDCPEYPFDSSKSYWYEPRMSRDYRFRKVVPDDTLGSQAEDWTPLTPRWRKHLSLESAPWIKDHEVMGTVIYPATGMLAMALDAAMHTRQEDREVSGFYIQHCQFISPIIVGKNWDDSTEVIVQLRYIRNSPEKKTVWSEVEISTHIQAQWTLCFKATIQTEYQEAVATQVDHGKEKRLKKQRVTHHCHKAIESCTAPLDSGSFYQNCQESGLSYGKSFQLLNNIRWDGDATVIASVDLTTENCPPTSFFQPAVLDCAFQLFLARTTNGLTDAVPAAVPSILRGAWFAASGWQPPDTSSLHFFTNRVGNSNVDLPDGSLCVLSDSGLPVCSIKRLSFARVSTGDDDQKSLVRRPLLYGIEWAPQLSLLSKEQLYKACDADSFVRSEDAMVNDQRELRAIMGKVIRRTLNQISSADLQKTPDYLKRHFQWMQGYANFDLTQQARDVQIDDEELEMQLRQIEIRRPAWGLFPAISQRLAAFLLGESDPLQVLFEKGRVEKVYSDNLDHMCDHRFQKLVKHLTHENPNLRILEVGAGTGAMTARTLFALEEGETRDGGMKFTHYTYTDISPAFFEQAQSKFEKFEERISYRTLDLEIDPTQQGFEAGSYDLIIAASVMHVTSDLGRTIQGVRTLLKPGGHLLYVEPVVPDSIIMHFGWGVLPGWWLNRDKDRGLCPIITEQAWDEVLRGNGFSGNDVVLRDFESDDCHLMSIMLSTALISQEAHLAEPGRLLFVLQDKANLKDSSLAKSVHSQVSQWGFEIVSLGQLKNTGISEKDVVICLLETEASFFAGMSNTDFSVLKDLIDRSHNLFWVTDASRYGGCDPHAGMMEGFFRSMRSENVDKRIITLSFETSSPQSENGALLIARIFKAAFETLSPELEYRESHNQITTARMTVEEPLNAKVQSFLYPLSKKETWIPGPPLKLVLGAPGFLDTFVFEEDVTCKTDLGPYEIEIETKAWALNFRDVLSASGRLEDDHLGLDCSGLVTRVGASCTAIRVGDRIAGFSLGCMRTYTRAHERSVIKIPESLSFEAASSIITPGVTAYHSLIEVARLKKGERILIHSGAGATGQMAIMMAKMVGAEIFTTVSLDEKRQFLTDTFGIPEDHILYNRDQSFAEGVMRLTNEHGVDVVLNSLSGDGLRASWECIAPFGRFVELGKADVMADSGLPMSKFARNVSFSCVDVHHMAREAPCLAGDLLECTMRCLNGGQIELPGPLHTYPLSRVEDAFRYLQSGKSKGRIVVSVQGAEVVQKRLLERPSWQFDSEASYMIAGGLGGLGRSVILWMATKGAKHIIVPSRTGPSSSAAADIIATLREKGVNISTPICDISSSSSLAALISDCVKTMPPIKGCINATLVLQDAMFSNMTYAQWQASIQSKVATSWNLHEQLLEPLDFFLLFSSVNGVLGGPGLSNYAAGSAFQDSLARYRVTQGKTAMSLDIGWMRNIGTIAENVEYQKARKAAGNLNPIEDTELLAVLELACDRASSLLHGHSKSQLVIAPATPAEKLASGQPIPETLERPLYAAFSGIVSGDTQGAKTSNAIDFAALFRRAEGFEERASVAASALASKLARVLSVPDTDVDYSKQLPDFGIDSLMAVEIRNWIKKDFAANLAVFDIMGGKPISAVGSLIAEKSQIGKGDAKRG
ncbi:hypothetical protein GQX73_g2264 [Xylaria multiplex]|uniref:Uncharacterized protein n=1 Tax=Xylaria multiplex TaxID=323545 RepID=A0A7C8MTS4_9PEZI|nr:hypothetical protein GQX73_g2264 [Xylaria multiplex]